MTTQTVTYGKGRPRQMGQIHTDIELVNASDFYRALGRDITPSQVRSLTLPRVLVDPGASHLSLPSAVIAQLALPLSRDVQVSTANGITSTRIYDGLRVTVQGRTSSFECIELPGSEYPLLGVIVLEALGLQLDLVNQRLDLLPDAGPRGYLFV